MNKLLKKSTALALFAISASSLSSCGKVNFEFWSSFGSAYTQYLDAIVNDINEETGYGLKHVSKNSYDGIRTAVNSARTTRHHPSLMTGYPDHFADYISGNILLQLDDYIKAYDEANASYLASKGYTTILDDYYSDYMDENRSLDLKKVDGKVTTEKALSALPFNKSTELMGYNGTFVDYCATIDPTLAQVPATWQEWHEKGPKYRDVLLDLVKITDDNDASKVIKEGKVLYFDQDEEGRASNFSTTEQGSRTGKLDFTSVDSKETRVISWDATDNMFITLVRQWGSAYTELPDEELTKAPKRRKGHIVFNSEANKAATIACLQYFNEMNHDKVFGVPAIFGASFSSKAFEANKCMFMLCSSGGLSHNTADWNKRFRVAPLPYYDDGETVRKYVISQGANIALSNQGDEEMQQHGFDVMMKMTTAEYQARWCLNTGYYPCSKSATEHELYQEFLKGTSYADATEVAYREGSVLNEEVYMLKENGWNKFVDPAFLGSSTIRTKVKTIFELVFGEVKLNDDYSIAAGNKNSYEKILNDVCEQFANNTSVIVDK